MRYLEVSVQQSAEDRHPMHQFVVTEPAYEGTKLLYRHRFGESEHAALFHVDGPPEPYRTELAEESSVLEFEIGPCPDESFYLYVWAEINPGERAFADAFSQPGLLVVTPVEYRADGTVRVTAVGPADTVQSAVENIPETMGVDVLAVGEYFPGRIDARLELTQRQIEAVDAAVECGYYSTPRTGTLDDVAAHLDCASGTAGELLRRAERTVMTRLVDGGPFSPTSGGPSA